MTSLEEQLRALRSRNRELSATIDEQEHLIRAQQQNNRILSDLLDSIASAIVVIDMDMRIERCNAGALHVLERETTAMVGRDLCDALEDLNIRALRPAIESALSDQTPVRLSTSRAPGQGHDIDVHPFEQGATLIIHPGLSGDAKEHGVLHELKKKVLDALPYSTVLLGRGGTIRMFNSVADERAKAVWGRPLEVGAHIFDYTEPERRAGLAYALEGLVHKAGKRG